jgi:hypothetical protein
MAEGDKPTLGLMVLYRTGINRYSPAVIHKVNEDHTVDLTVFDPQGTVGPARSVQQGGNPGQWCHTGVDAREAVMKKAQEDLGRHGATGPDDKMAKVVNEEPRYQPSAEAQKK